ncbi:MAG: ethanolamine ammonia-lyase subunit EutB [Bacteriovoracaceae bacterium]
MGPAHLFNGKQIIQSRIRRYVLWKTHGTSMGCDICYTNHTDADQNDMDALLTLLGVAELILLLRSSKSDDIVKNYQKYFIS